MPILVKKRKKAESCAPEEMVGFWINFASRTVVRVLDARLRALGFAMSQLPVLRALGDGGALPQKELTRRARVEQPTMTEMLGRMERDGLIERKPNPEDGRQTLVSLSKSARVRFPKANAVLVDGERQAMTGFTEREKAVFLSYLQRVVNNVTARTL